LGKWKTKQLTGWVIKIYCHFQSMTHSILKTKKQCQQSYMSIQYSKSIRITILIISRFLRRQMVSAKKVHVQTTWNFRLRLNCTSSYQTHVTEVVKDMCDNWMVSFWQLFDQGAGVGIYFLIDIWGWVRNFCGLFNGWVSKMFAKKTISLRYQTPP
jgi:hypothetical protein